MSTGRSPKRATRSAYVRLLLSPSRAYAMGMPAQQNEWTADMVRALPDDGRRYELVDGELLVSPAPSRRHQAVLKRLLLVIEPYVREHRIGWTHWSPADIELESGDIVQPDLFVVPGSGDEEPTTWPGGSDLLLVIEGSSPTTTRNDRLKKRPAYQKAGIPEYWIVDIDSRLIERWRPEDDRPEIIDDVLVWQPESNISPLRVVLDEIFAGVISD